MYVLLWFGCEQGIGFLRQLHKSTFFLVLAFKKNQVPEFNPGT